MIGAMQDISSRKLYEERLILNERRFRSLVQDSSDMTAIINIDGDYEYVSPSVKNVLGFTPEYFIGKNAFQFIHPDDAETTVLSSKSIYDSDSVTLKPFRFQNAQGQWRWIETKLSNQIKNPSIQGIIANSRDITDQRNIQEELRTLALLAKQTNNAVLLTDVERRIIWVNEAFLKLYKYKWEQIIGQDPQDLLKRAETSETELGKIRESVKNSSPYQTEIILYSQNKEKRFVELQAQPVFNEKGQLVNYFSIHHDITEKRKLQRRLHREQKEKQRNITKAVIAAQERERNEIGKELHDNINQLLATIKLYLELIKKDKKYVDGLLDKSIGFVNEAITDIRRISHVLSYSSMEDLSLFDALKELIHSINLAEKTKIDLSFNIDESKVSNGIKLSIYRIIQEQANNILKYAKARQALIELSQANYSVKLKIQDDGIGFDPCKNKNGIGLCNIESRVMAYSGKLEIHSAPSKGCTLLIEFPLAESR
jgi:PAS domain S-box-containing protein